LEESTRPIILLSTSGTRLMAEASQVAPTYVACLRNVSALASHLTALSQDVRILGADSRGEFREEDQLCAARIARALTSDGYTTADAATEDVLRRFGEAADDAFLSGKSATYLRDTGQHEDLEFVLGHIDDLDRVFAIDGGEVRALPRP
ncbi:MAG TPA: 2-phosphosulfolactate phosphatase, partial [Solirubrobacteraceae bacterium]|nr:2-phosphosulfolactate phosphatase [Solirubrobacteraceae bacterium]